VASSFQSAARSFRKAGVIPWFSRYFSAIVVSPIRRAQLRFPDRITLRKFMDEQDRRAAAGLLAIEARGVFRGGIGHGDLLALAAVFRSLKVRLLALQRWLLYPTRQNKKAMANKGWEC
jgi:hypothetical protein